MLTKSALLRAAAVTALIGGMAIANPVYAASATGSSSSTAVTAPATGDTSPEKGHMDIETRIKTLHDKLSITSDQEDQWNDLAQAMRDNEGSIKALVDQRHQGAENMTAVEDLESYQKIAQAHVDGLGKIITAFEPLYGAMSEDQKKNADEVFGRFEGHRGTKSTKSHKKTSK